MHIFYCVLLYNAYVCSAFSLLKNLPHFSHLGISVSSSHPQLQNFTTILSVLNLVIYSYSS